MKKYQEGDCYVFEEKTTKPFERFRIDATRGLMQGLSALFTTHEWRGMTCYVQSLGAESTVNYDHGHITVRVRIHSLPGIVLKEKILSDIENVTREVSGVIDEANKDVFIVHGHNDAKKTELRSFLNTLGLRPIILDEEDDRGMTIIEKFEYYASTCAFAFVLMTPDDKTASEDEVESKWRARQNVVMELGWFMARLDRQRVVILYQRELEISSDILGVVYLRFNESILEISERIRQRLRSVNLIS